MNYNAFCFGKQNGIKSIFSPILLSEHNMGNDYIYNLQHCRPQKSIIIHLFSLFLNADGMSLPDFTKKVVSYIHGDKKIRQLLQGK